MLGCCRVGFAAVAAWLRPFVVGFILCAVGASWCTICPGQRELLEVPAVICTDILQRDAIVGIGVICNAVRRALSLNNWLLAHRVAHRSHSQLRKLRTRGSSSRTPTLHLSLIHI